MRDFRKTIIFVDETVGRFFGRISNLNPSLIFLNYHFMCANVRMCECANVRMCLMRIFTDRSGFIEKELPKMDGKVLLLKLCPLKKAGTIINIVVTYKLRM